MTAEEDKAAERERLRAKFLERQDAQITKVKADLAQWIDVRYPDHNLNAVIMNALLQSAFERFIDLHGEKDALELIVSRFHRTAKTTRPALH